MDAAGFELLRDPASVRLAEDVAREIQLAQQLIPPDRVAGVLSFGENQKMAAGQHTGEKVSGAQIPVDAPLLIGGKRPGCAAGRRGTVDQQIGRSRTAGSWNRDRNRRKVAVEDP